MQKRRGKLYEQRGLSPVIATVLLIAIALILALIILLWARGFISEKTQKFGEPIENACQNIVFESEVRVDAKGTHVTVANKGSVALYGVEVIKKGIGSTTYSGHAETTITIGDTKYIEMGSTDLSSGDNIIVLPVILGETEEERVSYTCD